MTAKLREVRQFMRRSGTGGTRFGKVIERRPEGRQLDSPAGGRGATRSERHSRPSEELPRQVEIPLGRGRAKAETAQKGGTCSVGPEFWRHHLGISCGREAGSSVCCFLVSLTIESPGLRIPPSAPPASVHLSYLSGPERR